MKQIQFYDCVDDAYLQFAVIAAKSDGKWVFCKHKARSTWEMPGGHREPGEDILATARRELYEETGATQFTIWPVCVYSVLAPGQAESFGMLYRADILQFEEALHWEIEKIICTDTLPTAWTYPEIQPALLQELAKRSLD